MSARCEVAFELHGLVDRRRFWQRHQEDVGEARVAKTWKEPLHGLGACARFLQHLAVVGLGCVEQEQRVAGRCGVDDDELPLALGDRFGERPKHGDLFSARAAKILFQQRLALRVEGAARGRQDLFGVAARLELGVDARHPQLGRAGAEVARGLLHVGSGVGGRQRDREATLGERASDACRDRRLADAALAHGHDDALASFRELRDQGVEALPSERTRG